MERTPDKQTEKSILLVVNNLGCNGSPLYAHSVAKLLLENHFRVTLWSYWDGILRDKFEEDGIALEIVNPKRVERESIEKKAREYDCLLAFTITTYQMVQICRNVVPTVWYIHEGQNLPEYLQDKRCMRVFLQKNRMWVVSEYAQQFIRRGWGKKTTVIHNFVPCIPNVEKICERENFCKKFLVLGNMIERKAFDVVFDAFLELEEEKRQMCELHYAGEIPDSDYAKAQLAKVANCNNVIYHGVILDESIYDLYRDCDVVVVPSRDESCSLVTLEAAMMHKPVIVSENVGAKYMISEENGWIVKTGSVEELTELFADIIKDKYDLEAMGVQSGIKYREYATRENYESALLQMLKAAMPQNRSLWHLVHGIKNIYDKWRDLHEDPVFEELHISAHSRIVLYGAGENGHKWKERFAQTKCYKLVAWVDKYSELPGVQRVEKLKKLKFDYVLITVLKQEVRAEIEKELLALGVEQEKII